MSEPGQVLSFSVVCADPGPPLQHQVCLPGPESHLRQPHHPPRLLVSIFFIVPAIWQPAYGCRVQQFQCKATSRPCKISQTSRSIEYTSLLAYVQALQLHDLCILCFLRSFHQPFGEVYVNINAAVHVLG